MPLTPPNELTSSEMAALAADDSIRSQQYLIDGEREKQLEEENKTTTNTTNLAPPTMAAAFQPPPQFTAVSGNPQQVRTGNIYMVQHMHLNQASPLTSTAHQNPALENLSRNNATHGGVYSQSDYQPGFKFSSQSLSSNVTDSCQSTKRGSMLEGESQPVATETPKKFATGTSDFRELRLKDGYFVDKSMLIKEILDDPRKVKLLIRPRKFGKSINLSMLNYFLAFNLEDEHTTKEVANKSLFKGLLITSDSKAMQRQGEFFVLHFNFSALLDEYSKYDNESSFSNAFNQKLIAEVKEQCRVIDGADKIDSLEKLLAHINGSYNKKIVLTIDEYDYPLFVANRSGYFEKARELLCSFLQPIIGNGNIYQVVLTGIINAFEKHASGRFNCRCYNLTSPQYWQYFGFTDLEIEQLLDDYKADKKSKENFKVRLRETYGNIVSGKDQLYNPYSVICFIEEYQHSLSGEVEDFSFVNHWARNIKDTDITALLIGSSQKYLNCLDDLCESKELMGMSICLSPSLDKVKEHEAHFWGFLLLCGYLTFNNLQIDENSLDDTHKCSLKVPNFELSALFKYIRSSLPEEEMPSNNPRSGPR